MNDLGLAPLKAKLDEYEHILRAKAIELADAVLLLGADAPDDARIVTALHTMTIEAVNRTNFAAIFADFMGARAVTHYRIRILEHALKSQRLAQDNARQ